VSGNVAGMTENFVDINGQPVETIVKELIQWGISLSDNQDNRTATILMKIANIKGNVTTIKDYEEAIELMAFRLVAEHKVLVGFTGNIQSSAPVKMGNLVFVMPDGPTVELLIDACDKGTLLGDITIVILYNQASSQNEVRQEIVFKNCRFTLLSSAENRTVGSFGYSNIEVDYRCMGADNQKTGSVSAGFNLEACALTSTS